MCRFAPKSGQHLFEVPKQKYPPRLARNRLLSFQEVVESCQIECRLKPLTVAIDTGTTPDVASSSKSVSCQHTPNTGSGRQVRRQKVIRKRQGRPLCKHTAWKGRFRHLAWADRQALPSELFERGSTCKSDSSHHRSSILRDKSTLTSSIGSLEACKMYPWMLTMT